MQLNSYDTLFVNFYNVEKFNGVGYVVNVNCEWLFSYFVAFSQDQESTFVGYNISKCLS